MQEILTELLKIDTAIFLCLNNDMGCFADNVFWILSSKLVFIPICILTLWLIYKSYGLRNMLISILFIALIVLCADQGSGFFKHFTPKLRPTHQPLLEGLVHTVNGYIGGLYGTVSAHAANSFGVAMFTSMLLKKRWFSIFIFSFSVAVAYSRIYLGVHYPFDILFGTILGLIIGYLFYLLYIKIINKTIKS